VDPNRATNDAADSDPTGANAGGGPRGNLGRRRRVFEDREFQWVFTASGTLL